MPVGVNGNRADQRLQGVLPGAVRWRFSCSVKDQPVQAQVPQTGRKPLLADALGAELRQYALRDPRLQAKRGVCFCPVQHGELADQLLRDHLVQNGVSQEFQLLAAAAQPVFQGEGPTGEGLAQQIVVEELVSQGVRDKPGGIAFREARRLALGRYGRHTGREPLRVVFVSARLRPRAVFWPCLFACLLAFHKKSSLQFPFVGSAWRHDRDFPEAQTEPTPRGTPSPVRVPSIP